jgi:tetratricopeptide (TPR) repeat protein
MKGQKFLLLVLVMLITAPAAFCQSEALKTVVNNLAFYKQKKDLKYLDDAKKTVDSLIKASADTINLENNVYKAIVYSSILYIDSLNKLNQPVTFLAQAAGMVDRLSENRKIYKYQVDIDYVKNCLADVYIRKAFVYMNNSDYNNALQLFENAKKYAPSFKQLNAYIAYSNNKLGKLREAAKYYTGLIGGDSTRAAYVEAASNIYKSFGDTVTALEIVKKGRAVLPNDRSLLLDEANIYNNKKDYRSLVTLLPALLEINTNSAEIAFVAANCYDHLNQYDKAESLYLRAIELNSSAYEPIFDLGLLYFRQSEIKRDRVGDPNLARAIQWLEKANEISPNDIHCLQVLQVVYAQTGDENKVNRINNQLKQLINQ